VSQMTVESAAVVVVVFALVERAVAWSLMSEEQVTGGRAGIGQIGGLEQPVRMLVVGHQALVEKLCWCYTLLYAIDRKESRNSIQLFVL
jgi:hypothetical protein